MRSCFVLGSGRSGTSMVAGAIAGAGYFVGDDLIGARPANPRGFYEDRGVNRLNEVLLDQVVPGRWPGPLARFTRHRTRFGQRWLAPVPLGTRIAVPADVAAGIDALLGRAPFCFKDPRFCYTLPAWRDRCAEPPVVVCVFREPARVADSVVREVAEARYLADLRIDRDGVLALWTLQHRHVLDELAGVGEWVFLHYDQVTDGSGLDRLDAALDAVVDRGFVDPALVRSTSTGPVPAEAAEVYRALCERAGYDEGAGRG